MVALGILVPSVRVRISTSQLFPLLCFLDIADYQLLLSCPFPRSRAGLCPRGIAALRHRGIVALRHCGTASFAALRLCDTAALVLRNMLKIRAITGGLCPVRDRDSRIFSCSSATYAAAPPFRPQPAVPRAFGPLNPRRACRRAFGPLALPTGKWSASTRSPRLHHSARFLLPATRCPSRLRAAVCRYAFTRSGNLTSLRLGCYVNLVVKCKLLISSSLYDLTCVKVHRLKWINT